MFSVDLKVSYFQVPFHPELMGKRILQLEVLCFGHFVEPQVFTRVFTLLLNGVINGVYAFIGT